jgi:hypothetical protein
MAAGSTGPASRRHRIARKHGSQTLPRGHELGHVLLKPGLRLPYSRADVGAFMPPAPERRSGRRQVLAYPVAGLVSANARKVRLTSAHGAAPPTEGRQSGRSPSPSTRGAAASRASPTSRRLPPTAAIPASRSGRPRGCLHADRPPWPSPPAWIAGEAYPGRPHRCPGYPRPRALIHRATRTHFEHQRHGATATLTVALVAELPRTEHPESARGSCEGAVPPA